MAKEFFYKGKTLEELQQMSLGELAKVLPARQRRSITRGFSDEKIELVKKLEKKNQAKTHLRDMIILPQWVGKTIRIHNGKDYFQLEVQPEMIGHFLGEYALTRNLVKHSSPGVGATRSSSAISVK